MAMSAASIREYVFGLVKASFHALNISSLRYRKRYRLTSRKNTALHACKNLIQKKKKN